MYNHNYDTYPVRLLAAYSFPLLRKQLSAIRL